MKRILLLVFIPFYCLGQPRSELSWQIQNLAEGLQWKRLHTEELFDSWQHINILEVDTSFLFTIEYVNDTLLETSELAKKKGALAAINGGFFDMKKGGSVTYLEVEDQIINDNKEGLLASKNEILEGIVGINKRGKFVIDASRNAMPPEDLHSALITGPILLLEGQTEPFVDRSFTNARHPRTCACTLEKGNVLLITVDGRHEKAAGMSLYELAKLAQLLGCVQAINLDGGGSTTMYIKGKGNDGVVNCPSDNKKFDGGGERPCANAILVFSEDK